MFSSSSTLSPRLWSRREDGNLLNSYIHVDHTCTISYCCCTLSLSHTKAKAELKHAEEERSKLMEALQQKTVENTKVGFSIIYWHINHEYAWYMYMYMPILHMYGIFICTCLYYICIDMYMYMYMPILHMYGIFICTCLYYICIDMYMYMYMPILHMYGIFICTCLYYICIDMYMYVPILREYVPLPSNCFRAKLKEQISLVEEQASKQRSESETLHLQLRNSKQKQQRSRDEILALRGRLANSRKTHEQLQAHCSALERTVEGQTQKLSSVVRTGGGGGRSKDEVRLAKECRKKVSSREMFSSLSLLIHLFVLHITLY